MKKYIRMHIVFKVVASIFFLWIHSPYNNLYNFGNNLESVYNVEITSDIRFQRSLAKHVVKKELNRSKIRDVISENNSYNNVKYTSEDLSECPQLKKKELNDLEIYKEQFKRKYPNRKGLKRLECYCEKKIFDMIDKMREQELDTSSNNINLKKYIFKKSRIRTIVVCLFLLIGIIIPILDAIIIQKKDNKEYSILSVCGIQEPLFIIYGIFFLILIFIILFSIIYTMIKIVKYERLEAGRGKLNFR